jgi:aryl-alcohol dehydrogenase-like predicted oxidoreductase
MERRMLGGTGVSVSSICLGAAMFGRDGNHDHDNGIRVIQHALDGGVNFIDTADFYSAGESEQIVGKAIAGRRDDIVLATKFSHPMGEDANHRGTSRRWIMRAVEDSLRRLGTDYVDLYQVHRPSSDTGTEETLGALTDLVRDGKVRYIGSSTFPASHIVEAQWTAQDRRLERFVCEQAPYSMLVRGIEADVLPTCGRYRVGVIAYSPLASGWLSGRWRVGAATPTVAPVRQRLIGDRFDLSLRVNQRKLEATEALAQLAEDAGLSLVQIALAFVLNHPQVTAAIIGPRSPEQLESYLSASDVSLDETLLDRIDQIVTPGGVINLADTSFINPALHPSARRRRTTDSPAAWPGRPRAAYVAG